MTKKTLPIFVYGTLRLGEANFGRIQEDVLSVQPATVEPARLWHDGSLAYLELRAEGSRDLPGAPWRRVRGELMRLRDRPGLLASLDRFEGYAGPGSVYVRTWAAVRDARGRPVRAHAYVHFPGRSRRGLLYWPADSWSDPSGGGPDWPIPFAAGGAEKA